MKRFYILFLLCMLLGSECLAQDVIITKDAKRINCSVKEIYETEIRYKRQDNPNGPIFIISTSRVSSIVFANGETMMMEDDGNQNIIQTIPPIQIKPSSVALDNEETLLLEEHINHNLIQTNTSVAGLDSLSFPVTVSLNKIITYSPGKKLEYKNGGWYYDNKYLDDSELEVFLTQTCWDANSHKTLGDVCGVLGWDILLPSGAILLITGAYRADIAEEHGISYDKKTIGFLIGGLSATTLGIVCVITKHTMKKKITNTFNQECGRIPQNNNSSNLSLGFSPYGASITYCF